MRFSTRGIVVVATAFVVGLALWQAGCAAVTGRATHAGPQQTRGGKPSFVVSDAALERVRTEVKKEKTNFNNVEERYNALQTWGIKIWEQPYGQQVKPRKGANLAETFDMLQIQKDDLFHEIDRLYADFEKIEASPPAIPATTKRNDQVRLPEQQRTDRMPEKYGDPAAKSVEVDCSQEIGQLRNLNGVNGPPEPVLDSDPEVTAAYKEAAIAFARVDHDNIKMLLDNVFPASSRPDADPDNPNEYDFSYYDQYVGAAVNNGITPVVTVEFALGPAHYGRMHQPVPADFEKWAEVAKHVVMHINKGWADGHQWGVKYWAIWNEPDIPKGFWTGTPEEYYELFDVAARKMMEADGSIKVGGPGAARAPAPGSEFLEGFLKYCAEHKTPIGFVEWHCYAARGRFNPYLLVESDRNLERMVAAAGLPPLDSVVGEWNMGAQPTGFYDQAVNAVFNASALAYMQDTGIDIPLYFRATGLHVISGTQTSKDRGMNLVFHDGTPRIGYYGFRALAEMYRKAPVRVSATGSDTQGYAVLAGKSREGKSCAVLISDLNSQSNGFHVKIKNLPWNEGDKFSFRRTVVDDSNTFKTVETGNREGKGFELEGKATSPALTLIVLEKT